MLRLLAPMAAFGLAALGLGSTALAEPALASWETVSGSYLAVGSGLGQPSQTQGNRYAATGFDARGVAPSGHGGFFRFEQGGTRAGTWLRAEQDVTALDVGYAFRGSIVGDGLDKGLVGFLEFGLSGWQSEAEQGPGGSGPERGRSGFGLAYGASIEGRVAGVRLGVAVQRRDIPFFVGPSTGHTASTTLQLRVDL